MSDFASALEGLDPAIIEAISKPEVMERITGYVEKAKVPVLDKNKELLGKYSDLNKQINDLGGFDSLKELANTASEAKRQREEALAKSGDVEAIRKQAAEAVAVRDTEISSLRQSMIQEKVNTALVKAVRDAKGDADLLSPHLAARIQGSLDSNNKVVIKVLDSNGQPMVTKDMKDASISDLVAEYRTSYPRAFDADTKTGSGAKAVDTSTQGIVNPFLAATRNLSAQNQLARDNPTLAKALAAAAGKTLNI